MRSTVCNARVGSLLLAVSLLAVAHSARAQSLNLKPGYAGAKLVTDTDGTPSYEMPVEETGLVVPMLGLGYQQGLAGAAVGHLVLMAGAAYVVKGDYLALIRQRGFPKAYGLDTRLGLVGQVSVPVAEGARRTQLSLGLRAKQTFALGRHALLAVASASARFDTGARTGGLELALGGGYAVLFPPFALPVVVEVVYDRFGIYPSGAWSLRFSLAW